MSLLIRPRRGTGKQAPGFSTQINYGHPIVQGIRGLFTVGDGGIVLDHYYRTIYNVISPRSVSFFEDSRAGRSLRWSGSTSGNGNLSIGNRSGDLDFNTPFTVLARIIAPSATGAATPTFGNGSSNGLSNIFGKMNNTLTQNSWTWSLHLRNNANVVTPEFLLASGAANNGGSGAFSSPTLTGGREYDIAVVCDLSNIRMFVDGIGTSTTVARTITQTNVTANAYFIGGDSNSATACDMAFIHAFVWARALSQTELLELKANPYVMLHPQPKEFFTFFDYKNITPSTITSASTVNRPPLLTSRIVATTTFITPRVFTQTPLFTSTGASSWLLETNLTGTATQSGGDLSETTDNTTNALGRAKAISGGTGIQMTDFDGFFFMRLAGGMDFVTHPILATDSFNRQDSTTTLSSTNGSNSLDPLAWVPAIGTWGISGQQAYCSSGTTGAVAYVETLRSDIDISVTLTQTSNTSLQGIAFRYSGTGDFWRLQTSTNGGTISLIRKTANSDAFTVTASGVFGAPGDIFRVVAVGIQIYVYRNGTLILNVTDTSNGTTGTNTTATKHGLYSNASATLLFDNFTLRDASGGATRRYISFRAGDAYQSTSSVLSQTQGYNIEFTSSAINVVDNTGLVLRSVPKSISASTNYEVRLQVRWATIRVKMWPQATPEPTNWDVNYVESSFINGSASIWTGTYKAVQQTLSPSVLASDSFNRADNASTLGFTDNANGGSLPSTQWIVSNASGSNTLGISSNQAYTPNLVSNWGTGVIDFGTADIDMSVTIATMGSSQGLTLRYVDTNNFIYIMANSGNSQVVSIVNGSAVPLAIDGRGWTSGDVLRVVAVGSSISWYRNGTLWNSTTSTFQQTATKHGIYIPTNSARLDNFTASLPAATIRTFNVSKTALLPMTSGINTDPIEILATKATASNGVATSLSFTKPTLPVGTGVPTPQNGDVMIMAVANGGNNQPGFIEGWTKVDTKVNAASGVGVGLYWRVYGTTQDVATGQTSWLYQEYPTGVSSHRIVFEAIYRGLDTTNPIDAFASTINETATTTHTAPSVTGSFNNTIVQRVVVKTNALAASTFGAVPNGIRFLTDTVSQIGTAAPACEILVTDEIRTSSGATGTQTFTSGTAEKSIVYTLALKPQQVNPNLFLPQSDGSWNLGDGHTYAGETIWSGQNISYLLPNTTTTFERAESVINNLTDFDLTFGFDTSGTQTFGGTGTDQIYVAFRSIGGSSGSSWSANSSSNAGVPTGGYVWIIRNTGFVTNIATNNLNSFTKALSAATLYRVRIRVRGMRVQARVWLNGSSEPSTWDYDGYDYVVTVGNSTPISTSGAIKFSINSSAAAANRAFDLYDIVANSLPTSTTPDLIGSTTTSATATSVVASVPSNVANGDVLIALCNQASTATAATTPTGWTLVPNSNTSLGTYVFYKIWVTGDPMTMTFQSSTSTNRIVSIWNIRNADIGQPTGAALISAVSGNQSSGNTTATFPAVTTTANNSLVMHLVCASGLSSSNYASSYVQPTGESIAGAYIFASAQPSIMSTTYQAVAGSTGTPTGTLVTTNARDVITLAIGPFTGTQVVAPATIARTSTIAFGTTNQTGNSYAVTLAGLATTPPPNNDGNGNSRPIAVTTSFKRPFIADTTRTVLFAPTTGNWLLETQPNGTATQDAGGNVLESVDNTANSLGRAKIQSAGVGVDFSDFDGYFSVTMTGGAELGSIVQGGQSFGNGATRRCLWFRSSDAYASTTSVLNSTVGYGVEFTNTAINIKDNTYTTIRTVAKTLTSGVTYDVRVRFRYFTIAVKVWPNGTAEPSTWDLNYVEPNFNSGSSPWSGKLKAVLQQTSSGDAKRTFAVGANTLYQVIPDAIELILSNKSTGSGTSLTINAPTSGGGATVTPQNGDVMVMAVYNGANTAPGNIYGWTKVDGKTNTSGGVGVSLYWRVFGAGQTWGPYSDWPGGTLSTQRAAIIGIYRGLDTTNPIDTFASTVTNAGTTTHVCPSVTTSFNNTVIVRAVGKLATTNMAAYPGQDRVVQEGNGLTVTDEMKGVAGATGTASFTSPTSDISVAYTLALKPQQVNPNLFLPQSDGSWVVQDSQGGNTFVYTGETIWSGQNITYTLGNSSSLWERAESVIQNISDFDLTFGFDTTNSQTFGGAGTDQIDFAFRSTPNAWASGQPSGGYVWIIRNTGLTLNSGGNLSSISKSLNATTLYRVRYRVRGQSVRARIWLNGSSEPTTWDYDGFDWPAVAGSTGPAFSSGSLKFSFYATGAGQTNRLVDFYDILANSAPVPVGDIYVHGATSTAGSSVTTVTASVPSTVANGDVLVALCTQGTTTTGATTPSGWTLLQSDAANGTYVFSKVWLAGDPTTMAFGSSTSSNRAVTIWNVRGADTSASIISAVNAGQTGSTTVTFPTVTTSINGSLVMHLMGAPSMTSSTGSTFTVPTGESKIAGWNNSFIPGIGSEFIQSTAGTVSSVTGTCDSTSVRTALTIAIAPFTGSTIVNPATIARTSAFYAVTITGIATTPPTSPIVTKATVKQPFIVDQTRTVLFAPVTSSWLLETQPNGTATQDAGGDVFETVDNTTNSLGRAKAISGGVGVDFSDFDGYFSLTMTGGAEFGGSGTTRRCLWFRASDTYASTTSVLNAAQGIGVELTSTGINIRDNTYTTIRSVTKALTAGVTYNMRVRFRYFTVSVKVWQNGTSEPTNWDINYVEANFNSGSYAWSGKLKQVLQQTTSGDAKRTLTSGATTIYSAIADPIELIASRLSTANTTALTINNPTTGGGATITPQNGDVMIMAVYHGANVTPGIIQGWTKVDGKQNSSGGVGVSLYWRVFNTVSSTSWTYQEYSGGVTTNRTAIIGTYRGLDTTNPIDTWSSTINNTSTTSHVCPSVTTSYNNSVVVRAVGKLATSAMATYAGQDRVIQEGTGLIFADEMKTTAGSTGTATFTSATSDLSITFTLALRPTSSNSNLFLPNSDGSWVLLDSGGGTGSYAGESIWTGNAINYTTPAGSGTYERAFSSVTNIQDFEMTFGFETSGTQGFGGTGADNKWILARMQGTWTSGDPTGTYYGWTIQNTGFVANSNTIAVSKALSANTLYRCRIRMNGAHQQVRIWNDGASEPTTWNADYYEYFASSTGTKPVVANGGSVGFSLYNTGSGNANRILDFVDIVVNTPSASSSPEIYASAQTVSTSSNFGVNLPSGVANNDILILTQSSWNYAPTTPSGWTLLQSDVSGGNASNATVSWKKWQTGDPTSVTIPGGSGAIIVDIYVVRGADPNGTPISAKAVSQNSLNMTFPSVTTTNANNLVIHYAGSGYSSSYNPGYLYTGTVPTGESAINNEFYSYYLGTTAFATVATSAGATTASTSTISSSFSGFYATFTIAIAPLSPSATVSPSTRACTASVKTVDIPFNSRSVSDAANGFDTTVAPINRNVSDSANGTDSASGSVIYSYNKAVSDAANGTDHLAQSSTVSISDSASGSDSLVSSVTFAPYDTWRPRVNPAKTLILSCRTPVGELYTGSEYQDMELWTWDIHGHNRTRVLGRPSSYGWVSYGGPEWSPDGTKVAIWVETSSTYALHAIDVSNWTTAQSLSRSKPAIVKDPFYSPDGTKVVFAEYDGTTNWHISTINVDGSGYAVKFTSTNELASPSFSPDGTQIAFTEKTSTSGFYGHWRIRVYNLSTNTTVTMLDDGNAHLYVRWLGNYQLVCQAYRYGTDSSFQIGVVTIATGAMTILTTGEFPEAVAQ